ncbi:MAG TPA: cellulase family glycosylhydrolase [Polyangiaceae bacterium]
MLERWRARLGLAVCCSSLGCASAARSPKSALDTGPIASFEVDGAPLCFVGANNYYLTYKPKQMVDGVLEAARAMGVKVVRLWGFIDRGSLDGSVPSVDGDGSKDGHYFQAWDPAQHHAVYNDGPSGLQGLDYALAKASSLQLKVVLVLTNNWREFGGMDQYLAWYGMSAHQDFYTDLAVKQAYKDWVAHLVTHVNVLTQHAYRDDPTIFAWELGNEPRGAPGTPSSVLNDWVAEMSGYLKALDPQHLVAVGDEGFFEQPATNAHWTYHANNGVDHAALSALPNIDYGTFHMYPDTWGTGFAWPERWIDDHLRLARELGKPTVLEEYGLKVTRDELGRVSDGLAARLASYQAWNERVLTRGGNAAMFWLLAGKDESGGIYPDYDHFSVYGGDQTSDLLRGFAQRFANSAPACLNAAPQAAPNPSPFVHVRNRQVTAFGWHAHASEEL